MIVVDSTPYPWPYDGRIVADRTALVICGAVGEWAVQTPEAPGVEAHIDQLRSVAASTGLLVVLVSQASGHAPYPLPLQGSVPLSPHVGEEVVAAAGIDAFYGSPLDSLLRRSGRSHLFITGRGFETTIHSTLRRANDLGYECLTVSDACAELDPRLRPACLSTLQASGGVFGAVASTASVLHAFENRSGDRVPLSAARIDRRQRP